MDYSLKSFEYDKSRKQLKAPTSKFVYGSFPIDLIVQSHVTGVRIQFRPIGENHPLFDQDQWDGEQRIYEPILCLVSYQNRRPYCLVGKLHLNV